MLNKTGTIQATFKITADYIEKKTPITGLKVIPVEYSHGLLLTTRILNAEKGVHFGNR